MTEYIYQDIDGVQRSIIIDPDKPYSPTIRVQQDVEPIIDSVMRDRELMRNDGPNKLLARIPVSVFEQACAEEWDEGDWKKYLNSSDAAPFRIWQGEV